MKVTSRRVSPSQSVRSKFGALRSFAFIAGCGVVRSVLFGGALFAGALFGASPAFAQTPAATYQPKFPGDPARSDSEAAALAYMRVVLRAQHRFEKQYGHFAVALAELVHSGSFTKRMVDPNRGDYTAGFKGKKDSFILTMTPQHLDAQHRSFYAEDDGKIHAEEDKPADADSPVVK
ncbi:MAG: hypothetical protein ABSF59_08255 [Candidatus Sulfotelmatobacter sp.]|jgi:hypothetical protein